MSEPTSQPGDIGLDDVNSFGSADPADAEENPWLARLSGNKPPEEIVDAVIVDDPNDKPQPSSPLKGDRPAISDRPAKGGIPDVNEWMSFWSGTAIRLLTDFYIELAFSGVDEEIISPGDYQRIKLKIDERNRIARPFAEFSHKSKFMRKHGRAIIASGESIDAILMLGMWFARVNRIAWKYKRMMANGYHKPAPEQFKSPKQRVPQTAPPSEEVQQHERTRSSPTDTGTPRPGIGEGIIISPGSS